MSRASLVLLLILPVLANADVARVAVASNFLKPARDLVTAFSIATGQDVTLISASTGKLYAQIAAGAPFDVFLAADVHRPDRLVENGFALERRVYAIGRLVLVSADAAFRDQDCRTALLEAKAPTVAIANPLTAPYGKAADAWLGSESLPEATRIVRGENVGQAMTYVVSGAAQFGVVARSLWLSRADGWPGCEYPVPESRYPAVRQAAALLVPAESDAPAREFFAYLFSAEGRAIIERSGYALPAGDR